MARASRASEHSAVYTLIVLLRAVCCVIIITVVNGLVGVCESHSKGCHISLMTL